MRPVFGIPSPEDPKARSGKAAGDHAIHYTEYTVTQKPEGKYRLFRTGMILLYILFAVTFFLLCTAGPVKIPMLIALLPVSLWILVYYTFRYVSLEYEYTLSSGVMTFVTVYGGRTRRVLFALPIKDMTEIAPLCAGDLPKNTLYDLRGDKKATDAYRFAVRTSDGKEISVLFQPTEKALKILEYYNPTAFPPWHNAAESLIG